jgi:hypothetical protein
MLSSMWEHVTEILWLVAMLVGLSLLSVLVAASALTVIEARLTHLSPLLVVASLT